MFIYTKKKKTIKKKRLKRKKKYICWLFKKNIYIFFNEKEVLKRRNIKTTSGNQNKNHKWIKKKKIYWENLIKNKDYNIDEKKNLNYDKQIPLGIEKQITINLRGKEKSKKSLKYRVKTFYSYYSEPKL